MMMDSETIKIELLVYMVVALYWCLSRVLLGQITSHFQPQIGWDFEHFVKKSKQYISENKEFLLIILFTLPVFVVVIVVYIVEDKYYKRHQKK